jgi:hypothetical protein
LVLSTACPAVVVVSGSTNQPSINGDYRRAEEQINCQAVFAMADDSYALYWMPNNGQGQWVISEEVGHGFRAQEEAGASPTGTELPWTSRSWRTAGGAIATSMPG